MTSKKRIILRNFLFFIPLVTLIGIFLFYIYSLQINNEIEIISLRESQLINNEKDSIAVNFESIISDLKILNTVTEYLSGTTTTYNTTMLEDYYLSFSQEKNHYDQVRFIDNTGTEKIRVDYNYGDPILKDGEDLQNKSKRYYFTNSIQLDRGAVFVSPLDLNIENGIIERPKVDTITDTEQFYNSWRDCYNDQFNKPMIRFATPVLDESGNKKGIVILNYYGAELINFFEQISEGSNGHILLANSDGFFLNGINHAQEWGFMIEHEYAKNNKIQNDFPELWEKLKQAPTGQFTSALGLYTYTKIHPLQNISKNTNIQKSLTQDDNYYWTIFSFVPNNVFKDITSGYFLNLIIFYLFIILILIIIVSIITAAQLKTRSKEKENMALQDQYNFISTMSHQLRTPITAIMLNCGVMRKEFKDQNLYNEMHGRLTNLNLLISNLLMFNEVKDNYEVKNTSKCSVYSLIKDNLSLMTLDIKAKKLKIINDKPDFDDALDIDREKISKSLYYIINNAVSYNKENGEIKIDIAKNHNTITISFYDTGIGIPKNEQSKIFDKFFRASNASLSKNEGSGISLFLAKIFIEAHGGKIRFISTEGVNTTFSITLPIK